MNFIYILKYLKSKIMKHIKTYNESIIHLLKGKSKDEMKNIVYSLPYYKKYVYIEKHDLYDLFTEKELEEFESKSPEISEMGKWFDFQVEDKQYHILIQGNDIDTIIILDENLKEIEDYDTFKYINEMEDYLKPYL